MQPAGMQRVAAVSISAVIYLRLLCGFICSLLNESPDSKVVGLNFRAGAVLDLFHGFVITGAYGLAGVGIVSISEGGHELIVLG